MRTEASIVDQIRKFSALERLPVRRHVLDPQGDDIAPAQFAVDGEAEWPAPSFAEFWAGHGLELPQEPDDGGRLRAFKEDPVGAPLKTPSGRIEVFSSTIASFGEPDCPGHPAWLPPADVPSPRAPLMLIANQPAARLHSQLDFGGHSSQGRHRGREVARMHPDDAASRGISDGDIIRIFNARGACLAGVRVTDRIRRGVVQLPTGAWYDPVNPEEEMPLCVHGNPNVLTPDVGTSALAQGCTGQLTTAQIERFTGNLPPIQAFDGPAAGGYGRRLSAIDFIEAEFQYNITTRQVAPLFQTYDVLVTPTCTVLPLPIDAVDLDRRDSTVGDLFEHLAPIETFTALFNATGQPAISVPLMWSEEGLPIGIQLVGRFGADDLVLSLATVLMEMAVEVRRPSTFIT